MHRKKSISPTHEMYLKTLYQVRGRHQVARVSEIARGLGVSASTVSTVLKKLAEKGLVEHDRYGFVTLTPSGENIAECIVRRYSVLRSVLIELFGVDPEVADIDACMMEHAVSPETVARMGTVLAEAREGNASLKVVAEGDRDGDEVPGEDCEDCIEARQCRAALSAAEGEHGPN